ncbi:hypothetical protein NDU88_001987 [Pleurodeles waltl]|uniref:Uncharacterized protein n=1 Tax=Pleurodeles waltl TaxID=8319 RepID=A0AAV7T1G3_PLEWA|nr:hypothetical protein NDU88_001987 [Pleurodeles waltl]
MHSGASSGMADQELQGAAGKRAGIGQQVAAVTLRHSPLPAHLPLRRTHTAGTASLPAHLQPRTNARQHMVCGSWHFSFLFLLARLLHCRCGISPPLTLPLPICPC